MSKDTKPSSTSERSNFVNRPSVSIPALLIALAVTALLAYAFFR